VTNRPPAILHLIRATQWLHGGADRLRPAPGSISMFA
jgi:hypothetical protein